MKTSHLKLTALQFRLFYTIIILILLIVGLARLPGVESFAEPVLSRWQIVSLPRQGDIGGWVLAKGSDITHLVAADDGTLYCSVTGSGAPSCLFRSTDNGTTWRYTGGAVSINDIETIPGRPDLVYYSNGTDIYLSENKGVSFTALPHLNDVVAMNNVTITSFDVVYSSGTVTVAAGPADSDTGEYGGVYVLTDNATPAWSDTGIGAYDVNEVELSRYYGTDKRIFAAANNESESFLTIRDGVAGWNTGHATAIISDYVADGAAIILPGYSPSSEGFTVFIGLDSGSGTGDVFRADIVPVPGISGVADLNIGSIFSQTGTDVTSITAGTISGTMVLLAGSADSGHVYRSTDEGQTWTRSTRPATGQRDTVVMMDSTGQMRVTTSGQGSAFSCSSDGGVTFDQVSLIDTEISSSCIMDLAPSPQYSSDTTVFMLTLDITSMEYSLWSSVSENIAWKRILGTSLYANTTIERIILPPSYCTSEPVLYLYGLTGGSPVLWRSDDNGRSFVQYGVPFPIDVWSSIDADTLDIGCHDGTNGRVFTTTDGGQTWSDGTAIGVLTLSSIERSPDYANDGTIFVSSLGGRVYYSDDGGYSYRTLPLDAASPPFSGKIVVKADPSFAENGIVYAVSDAAGAGIYRFILGESDEWKRVDNSLPGTVAISDLHITEGGILYATNTDQVDSSADYGGVERSLNPSYHLFPSFDSVCYGLEDGVYLRQSWITENRIWSVDAFNDRLLTYVDTITDPVILVSPWNGEGDIDIRNAVLDWYGLEGATAYEWQLDYDSSFAAVVSGFTGVTGATSVHLPDLDPDTAYFWRVRATEPVSGPWSQRYSFITGYSEGILCPALLFPEAGAEFTSAKPLFQWSPIAGAEKYELLVATTNTFNTPLIQKTGRSAISGTAWQSETELAPEAVYFWKVRGIRSGSYSDWSAVGAFSIVSPGQTEHASSLVGTTAPMVQDLPVLLCPGYDNDLTGTRPLFQWNAVNGADCYELMVSTDTRFENPVIVKAGEYSIPVSAWRCNIALETDTAYYWKVRAVINGSYGSWSPVSAFLVGDESDPATSARGSETDRNEGSIPVTTAVSGGNGLPEWAVFMGIGLLIAITMLLIAILIALFMMRGRRTY